MTQIILNAYVLKHKYYKTDKEFFKVFKAGSNSQVQAWDGTCGWAHTRVHMCACPPPSSTMYNPELPPNRTAQVRWLEMERRKRETSQVWMQSREPRHNAWHTGQYLEPWEPCSSQAYKNLRREGARIEESSYCYLLPPVPLFLDVQCCHPCVKRPINNHL